MEEPQLDVVGALAAAWRPGSDRGGVNFTPAVAGRARREVILEVADSLGFAEEVREELERKDREYDERVDKGIRRADAARREHLRREGRLDG